MILPFLRAEWHKIPAALALPDRLLIERPDIGDVYQNDARRSLLRSRRGPLLDRVPETVWYEVHLLRERHLCELLVIGRCGWDAPGQDGNELPSVARRIHKDLQTASTEGWEPILWSHEKSGPFTILEGNTRLTAFAGAPSKPPLAVTAFVGLSHRQCYWHLPDVGPF